MGPSEFAVRTMAVPDDVPAWLALRERAIADLVPQPRAWLHADYAAEIFNKPWWKAERNWLAYAGASPQVPVGAVTLAMRDAGERRTPVVHWLLVDPAWRRRGVGRVLMSYLENAAWDGGFKAVELETHSRWAAAVAFYQSIGYEPV